MNKKTFSYSKGEESNRHFKNQKSCFIFSYKWNRNQMFLDATVQNLLESQGYTANQSSPDYPKYKIRKYPTGNDILTKTLYWIFISLIKTIIYQFLKMVIMILKVNSYTKSRSNTIDLQRYGKPFRRHS